MRSYERPGAAELTAVMKRVLTFLVGCGTASVGDESLYGLLYETMLRSQCSYLCAFWAMEGHHSMSYVNIGICDV